MRPERPGPAAVTLSPSKGKKNFFIRKDLNQKNIAT